MFKKNENIFSKPSQEPFLSTSELRVTRDLKAGFEENLTKQKHRISAVLLGF
jgi:hypothetical protein